ncbi:S-layer homology domain-containing protein [Candidatus Gracilibacteria bacterium]|nr:S-layer homology domain-containing protein [Candidatus Gracilibacteria bacterium]
MKNIFRAFLLALTFGVGAKAIIERMKQEKTGTFLKQKIQETIPFANHFNKRKIRSRTHSWKRFFRENHASIVILSIVGLSFLGSSFLTDFSHLFRASLIGLQETKFTGTLSPIEKVPNWVALTDAERRMTFDQLPPTKLIPLPEYNILQMKQGMDYSTGHETERNTYLTYPVPNLGNYKLDAQEGQGSHTGIDIKTPIGTPVRSIANGIVYKTGNQTTGFGKHIVVAHVGIPDPENIDTKTTLFSAYAHLNEILVREGESITKGQIIGKSGETGMATAPHLHFQIDRSDAPFFPYWPFTWNDVQKAGLNSYFEAVKQGIGKERGEKYTVHPMNFVAQFKHYIGTENLVASTVTEVPVPQKKIVSPPPAILPESDSSQPEPTEPNPENSLPLNQNDIVFMTDRVYIPGEEKIVRIHVSNPDLIAQNGIEISSTLRDLAEVTPQKLTKESFNNGVAEIRIRAKGENTFKMIATGEFGEIKSDSLRAQIFQDIEPGDADEEAISFLKREGIIAGYPDGTFRPDNTLNRAEAVKILLTANDISITNRPSVFPDVPERSWFNNYVATAVMKGIVNGYGDGTFKPENTISRAEFLKVALEAANVELPSDISVDSYPDVRTDDWFAPYFEIAKKYGFLSVQRGGYIVPSQPITRSEAANVIYELSRL